MENSYQDVAATAAYMEFLNSPDGEIQKRVLWEHLQPHLPQQKTAAVLDAGCGNGWLAQVLSQNFQKIAGCDLSAALIEDAKINYPPGEFLVSDICFQQPFPDESFDVAILNMVAHDLADQNAGFVHLQRMLKPNGQLLTTIINPYYAFPVGRWKRGFWDSLLLKKPKLFLKAYNFLARKERSFLWKKNIPGFFYTLPETLNAALSAGFRLIRLEEMTAKNDSQNFDLNYRLYRFPILLLMKFEKTRQESLLAT